MGIANVRGATCDEDIAVFEIVWHCVVCFLQQLKRINRE
jgi:hypothetical protein